MAIAALVGVAAPAAAFGASQSPRKLTPLQQGLAFYRGKTITFIANGPPGNPFDLYARAEQPFLEAYLHATVNIEDIAPGNTIPAQDTAAAASPDGLTLGQLNELSDVALQLTKTPGLNFNPERVEFIASTGPGYTCLAALSNSPYTSFKQVEHSATPVTVLTRTAGTVNTLLRVFMGVEGIKVSYLSGYSSAAAQEAGFDRGDGPLTMDGLSGGLGAFMASGKARPLLINTKVPAAIEYADIANAAPDFQQIINANPPKTAAEKAEVKALNFMDSSNGSPTIFQTGVAADKLEALRAAFVWMYKQPAFLHSLDADALNPSYVNPVAAKSSYINLIAAGRPIAKFMAQ